jgi:hypothetical protein
MASRNLVNRVMGSRNLVNLAMGSPQRPVIHHLLSLRRPAIHHLRSPRPRRRRLPHLLRRRPAQLGLSRFRCRLEQRLPERRLPLRRLPLRRLPLRRLPLPPEVLLAARPS